MTVPQNQAVLFAWLGELVKVYGFAQNDPNHNASLRNGHSRSLRRCVYLRITIWLSVSFVMLNAPSQVFTWFHSLLKSSMWLISS